MEKEELLLNTNFAMVSLFGLFNKLFVLFHLLGIGERDAVNALQRVILLIP
jgi:hypothetical protein